MNISHEPSAKALLGKISVRGTDRKNKNDQGPRKITSILGYKKKLICYSTELLSKKILRSVKSRVTFESWKRKLD